jgi:hypothetical protein
MIPFYFFYQTCAPKANLAQTARVVVSSIINPGSQYESTMAAKHLWPNWTVVVLVAFCTNYNY